MSWDWNQIPFSNQIAQNNEALQRHADERDGVLREIANWVHDSVPVSKVRTSL